MGFSALGLALSLAIFAPNLLMVWFPPRSTLDDGRAPMIIVVLERVGQAASLTVPVFTVGGAVLWWCVVPVAVLLAAYWALWARYLASGRQWASLFAPAWAVPVPMAVLPVGVLFAASVWLTNGWIAVAAAVLAAGHVPRSLITARST